MALAPLADLHSFAVTGPGSIGRRLDAYEVTDQRRADLDSWTLPVFAAQQRLSAARRQKPPNVLAALDASSSRLAMS